MLASDSANTTTAELYRSHHGWLSIWLRRRLHSVDLVADLAQDTFIQVLTTRQLEAIREPRAFLTTIAKRVLANHYRRHQIEQAYLEQIRLIPEHEVPSLETRAILLETLMELDRRLDALPTAVRKVFLLARLDGYAYAEIAEQLSLSLTTVKRHMARAVLHCYFNDLAA